MPIQIFTEAERTKLDAFPEEITHDDLITFFTLSEADREQLPFFSAPHNRLGFAIQLCTLRFMGFVPEELPISPQPWWSMWLSKLTLSLSWSTTERGRRHARIILTLFNTTWATGEPSRPN